MSRIGMWLSHGAVLVFGIIIGQSLHPVRTPTVSAEPVIAVSPTYPAPTDPWYPPSVWQDEPLPPSIDISTRPHRHPSSDSHGTRWSASPLDRTHSHVSPPG